MIFFNNIWFLDFFYAYTRNIKTLANHYSISCFSLKSWKSFSFKSCLKTEWKRLSYSLILVLISKSLTTFNWITSTNRLVCIDSFPFNRGFTFFCGYFKEWEPRVSLLICYWIWFIYLILIWFTCFAFYFLKNLEPTDSEDASDSEKQSLLSNFVNMYNVKNSEKKMYTKKVFLDCIWFVKNLMLYIICNFFVIRQIKLGNKLGETRCEYNIFFIV